jgi:hypothetical protein
MLRRIFCSFVLFITLVITLVRTEIMDVYAASTLTVTNTNDSGAGSLRDAIAAASPGDTINFSEGVTGTIVLTSQLLIDKNLIIDGPGADLLTVSGNNAVRVFFIGNAAAVAITGLTIANGRVTGEYGSGGGIVVQSDSSLALDQVSIHKNRADGDQNGGGYGGGMYSAGTTTLHNVSITENVASRTGGGLFNSWETLTITNSLISKNQAEYGGGLAIEDKEDPSYLTNVTISGNTATSDGGGLHVFNPDVQLNNTTISNNTASNWGGGILTSSIHHVNLQNSILAGNTASSYADCYGLIDSQGNNLIQDTSGCDLSGNTTEDLTGLDPRLDTLADNGGPTQTHALQADSPAIDAGNDATCSFTDQRGIERPQGSSCDMGAYEVEFLNSAPTTISISSSSVNENQPIGTTVGSLSTIDIDAADSHTYNFCSGADDAYFILNGNLLKTAAIFDYETKPSYSICIRTTDSGNLNTTQTFTIGVNNLVDTQTFEDVSSAYWAWNFIERLYDAKVTGGCSTDLLEYCPESTVTRAQMAIFLLKGIHGSSYSPPGVGGSTGFGDVSTDHWAGAWIKQLAADGITSGCGGGNYCPEASVTRAQMAVFLLKAKYGASYNPPAVGSSTGFGDVPTDHWAAAWIKQLVAEGITAGCGNGNYCPEQPVTRAQMAVFLVKTFSLP